MHKSGLQNSTRPEFLVGMPFTSFFSFPPSFPFSSISSPVVCAQQGLLMLTGRFGGDGGLSHPVLVLTRQIACCRSRANPIGGVLLLRRGPKPKNFELLQVFDLFESGRRRCRGLSWSAGLHCLSVYLARMFRRGAKQSASLHPGSVRWRSWSWHPPQLCAASTDQPAELCETPFANLLLNDSRDRDLVRFYPKFLRTH
jgi:hypothetical protein